MSNHTPRPRRDPGWILRVIVAGLRAPVSALVARRWRGGENLPPQEGFVIAANHVSHVDPIMLAHFLYDNGVPPRYLAKAAILDVPVIGRILRSTGQIPVYRGTSTAANAYSAACAAVEAGEGVIFYPEGTITRDPGEWPMGGKTGAARVALTTGCPVIPIAQWGPNLLLAPYTTRPHLFPRKTMHVRAGAPVDLEDLRDVEATPQVLEEATRRIMDAVAELLSQIRDEPAPNERMSLHDPRVKERPRPARLTKES